MEGPDDTRARALLAAMQARIAGGSHAALGVAPAAGASEIRTAFMQLAKAYHPARFATLSPDVQRQANEVFLALRAAHDSLVKPVRPTPSMGMQRAPTPAMGVPTLPRALTPPAGVPMIAAEGFARRK